MRHPDEGTIHAWLDGALNDDESAEVERHIASCAECRAQVAEARGFIAGASRILSALDDIPAGVVPRRERLTEVARSMRTRQWVRTTGWVVAAGLMLAVGVETVGRETVAPNDVKTVVREGSKMIAAPAKNEPAQDVTPASKRGFAPIPAPPVRRVPPVESAAETADASNVTKALAGERARVSTEKAAPVAPVGAVGGASAGRAALGALGMRDAVRGMLAENQDTATRRSIPVCYTNGSGTLTLDTVTASGDFPGWRVLRDNGSVIGRWMGGLQDSLTLWIDRPEPRMLRGVIRPAGLELRDAKSGADVWMGRTACRKLER